MIVLMLCAATLVIVGCPETALGRALKRWLVDWPAKALLAVTPGRLLLLAVLLAVSVGVVARFEADGAMVLGMAAPEFAVWLAVFDVSTVIDIFGAVALVATVARLRGVRVQVAALMRRGALTVARRVGMGRQARRAVRRPSGRSSASQDDDGGQAGLWTPGVMALA